MTVTVGMMIEPEFWDAIDELGEAARTEAILGGMMLDPGVHIYRLKTETVEIVEVERDA